MLAPGVISRQVQEVVAAALAPYGFFSPSDRGVLTRRRGASVRDQVVLLSDVSDREGPIWATANLRVQAVQPPASPGRCPAPIALNWNIGYLTSARRWQQWSFSREWFDPLEAERLARCIVTYGLPWLDQFNNAGEIRAELDVKNPSGFTDLRRAALPTPGRARAS